MFTYARKRIIERKRLEMGYNNILQEGKKDPQKEDSQEVHLAPVKPLCQN